jgi:hypothetical protein
MAWGTEVVNSQRFGDPQCITNYVFFDTFLTGKGYLPGKRGKKRDLTLFQHQSFVKHSRKYDLTI